MGWLDNVSNLAEIGTKLATFVASVLAVLVLRAP